MKNSKLTSIIVSERFANFFALLVILIGLLVLIGWYFNLMFLTRFSINEVPMAPSTAYVFIFFATGLLFNLRPTQKTKNRNIAITSAVIVISLSCLIVVSNILKYHAIWEHLFIKISETHLNMRIGHMSFVTAFLFIISGSAWLFLLSNHKTVKAFSFIFTLIIFIISVTLLLGYGFNAPFFYFDNFIPPAALTVVSFLLISLALIATSNKKTFLVKTIWKESTSAKLLRVFLPTTLLITVVESFLLIRVFPYFNIHPAIAVALVSVIFIVFIIFIISIISKSIGKNLDSALENLSYNENLFRSISENAPVLINSFDEKGKCLFWNEQCIKIFGWTMEEINHSKVPMELFYPDAVTRIKVLNSIISDPDGSFREWNPIAKDGRILSIMWANFTLPTGQVFSMGHDITERKKTEQLLQQNKNRLDYALKTIETGAWELNLQTLQSWRSLKHDQIFGYDEPLNEWTFDMFLAHVFSEDRDEVNEKFQKAIATKKDWNFECRIQQQKNGAIRWIWANGNQEINKNNESIKMFGIVQDITERKLAEKALRESEKNLKSTFDLSPSIISTVNLNAGYFTEVNKAVTRILGYSIEKFTSKPFIEFIHPDDRQKVINERAINRKRNEITFFENRYLCSDGSYKWISWHTTKADEHGMVTAIGSDITDRKQIEEEIKKSQILLQQAEEVSNQGAWEFDIAKNKWSFSENWLQIHGCSLTGITLEEFMAIAHPEDTLEIDNAFKKTLKDSSSYNIEHRIIRQNDGEIRYVKSKGNLILNDSGQPIKMYGVSQDITNRKLEKIALKESEDKLNVLFASMTEMVVIHELVKNTKNEVIDYRIIECNNVFTKLTGIQKEDAINKLASEVYQTNPPPFLQKYTNVAQGGDPVEFTSLDPLLNKHLMISVVSPQIGKFATITTDISDMMEVQEIIMAKNKEMENYLYIASHDLRSPLVNIQGFSQRLKKQADSIKTLFEDKTLEPETLHQLTTITDEDIPKTLNFVLSNIAKMDILINGLLQLSRAGRIKMNIQKIDMNVVFSKILQNLDFQIKESQCKILIAPLPECYGDAELLDQLFENIISNALKYSDSERPLEITINATKESNKVVYAIKDTGKGMAQKHLEKIWDIFYRIDPRSGKTGEGIGLSLVKQITEKHKGKVWVKSEENKGSIFYIELHNRIFSEY